MSHQVESNEDLTNSLGPDSWRTNYSLIGKLADLSNEEAWAEFWNRYHPRICRWTRGWLASNADAEEAAEETIIRLVKYIRTYDSDKGKFRSWLRTCARRAAIEIFQRENKCVRAIGSGDDNDAVAALVGPLVDELESVLVFDVFRSACAKTKERAVVASSPRWDVFEATQLGTASYQEAAERYGVSVGNARIQAFRVRTELAAEMRRLGYEEVADGMLNRKEAC